MFRSRAWLVGLAVSGLMLAACAEASPDLTSETVPATSVSPATTTTMVATSTSVAIPTSTTVELASVALDYEARYREAVADIEDQELLAFLEAVKEYTIAFQDPAAAVAAGYELSENECFPTAGLHYINRDLIDDGVTGEIAPEAIMYEESESGLQLVGVEYFVLVTPETSRPEILGEIADGPTGVPHVGTIYWRHVWLYEKPDYGGIFVEFNHKVGCRVDRP